MEPRHGLDGAAWLWHPDLEASEPGFVVFRLRVKSVRPEIVRLQVSGDLCFALALDGALIARGPDSGDVTHWSFGAYELSLTRGNHVLEALVWWADPPQAPEGRMSWRGGFACFGIDQDPERFTTGAAAWRAGRLEGVTWGKKLNRSYHVIGCSAEVDLAKMDLRRVAWMKPAVVRAPIAWNPTGIIASGWQLHPAALPEQRHDRWSEGRVRGFIPRTGPARAVKFAAESSTEAASGWQSLLGRGAELTLRPRQAATVLIDTDDYLCGYPLVEFSGGAGTVLRWEWAESLFDRIDPALDNTPGPKGNRDVVAGKTFMGFGDEWRLGGRGRRWASSPWWRSGRYVLIRVKVGAQPVTLHSLTIERTGFPFESRAVFRTDDASIDPIIELSERGLRSCMHEVFVDCPYYEQMMYVADTRIQMLLAYVLAGDDRLARRGMELFDVSRERRGYPKMRFPSRVPQEGSVFAMIWPWMLHDFALWRGDDKWLRERLPGLRALLEALQSETDVDGLLVAPPGWIFADWVPGWEAGWPPGQREGRRSALVSLHYLLTLRCAVDLETWYGDPLMAQRWSARAEELALALPRIFWNEKRGLWADDESHGNFSQHAQALAIIGGLRAPDPARWADARSNGIAQATIYFQHYVFEALGRVGRGDLVLSALDLWRGLVSQGFKTPVESPEPSRSDCHAWGAHPVFHFHATIAGVRPASPRFRTVRIAPQPGSLGRIESELPHPEGTIRLRAKFAGERVEAEVELPPGISGVFVWRGQETTLRAGRQELRMG